MAQSVRLSDKAIKKTLTLTAGVWQTLQELSRDTELYNDSAAVRMCIKFYYDNHDIMESMKLELLDLHHELDLIKKYSNEQRRMLFLVVDLLNMICINQNVPPAPSFKDKDFQSSALQQSQMNLSEFLKDIAVKNKYGNYNPEDDLDDEAK